MPADWRAARAEFSPNEAGGHGLFYGPTHDVYSWMPRRVQWLDAVTGRLICDLETFSVQAGRRIFVVAWLEHDDPCGDDDTQPAERC